MRVVRVKLLGNLLDQLDQRRLCPLVVRAVLQRVLADGLELVRHGVQSLAVLLCPPLRFAIRQRELLPQRRDVLRQLGHRRGLGLGLQLADDLRGTSLVLLEQVDPFPDVPHQRVLNEEKEERLETGSK